MVNKSLYKKKQASGKQDPVRPQRSEPEKQSS